MIATTGQRAAKRRPLMATTKRQVTNRRREVSRPGGLVRDGTGRGEGQEQHPRHHDSAAHLHGHVPRS
ncbi:hypothetical protein ACGFNP_54485 [Nonomuraea sp. NPDC049269]|uniref:hypothetical protein n=1 Tax=Nonomuraea sp. NPDC049269 TaxID=3364349 RepID=UPI0037191BD0